MIRSGAEGIIQATLEAKRIAEARRLEKVKSTLFQTVLDYAYEGIISIDQDRQVVTFNPEAERITRIDGKRAIGRKIQDTLPQLKLERLLTTGKDELGQVIDVGRVQILCNKVPIRVQGTTIGAVATFQDTGKIQQWEANIRKKIYAEEHTAVFTFADVIGSSRQIRHCVAVAEQFAAADSSILISGETGTGKEVFSQSIHNASKRGQQPVRRDQLRRPSRPDPGERAVRLRRGRLHGGQPERETGPPGDRPRRHPPPRRNRRNGLLPPEQAAQGDSGKKGHAVGKR